MDAHTLSLVSTILFVFSGAIAGGVIAHMLRLPLFLGYIISGVVVGNCIPSLLNKPFLDLIADVGITLLLFTLGLEFSFHRLRLAVGTVVWAVVAQIVLVTAIVFLLLFSFSWGFLPSLCIGLAASLSSTAIVVKILSERGELETLPGEIMTAWLVIQDLSVIPMFLLFSSVAGVIQGGAVTVSSLTVSLLLTLGKSVIAIGFVLFLGKVGVPKALGAVASFKNKEIFLMTTVGFVFLSAIVTYGLGLSAALGAFLAGLLISETTEHHAVFAEVRPLRDVFTVLFFVSLGMALPLQPLISLLPAVVGMVIVILIIKFVIVFLLARFLNFHKKTAFLVAIGITQMSEFGFILAKEGVRLGAISESEYMYIIALVIATIFVSIPLFAKSNTLYYRLWGGSGKDGKKLGDGAAASLEPLVNHVVICGYGRVGKYVGRALTMANIPFVVIDYNHTTLNKLRNDGIRIVYGDPADMNVLDVGEVDKARMLVIAIPDRHTQELIIGNALTLNRNIKIFCRTHHEEDQVPLKTMGVTTVIQPEFEAALSIINKTLPEFGISGDDLSGKIARLKIEHGLA